MHGAVQEEKSTGVPALGPCLGLGCSEKLYRGAWAGSRVLDKAHPWVKASTHNPPEKVQ